MIFKFFYSINFKMFECKVQCEFIGKRCRQYALQIPVSYKTLRTQTSEHSSDSTRILLAFDVKISRIGCKKLSRFCLPLANTSPPSGGEEGMANKGKFVSKFLTFSFALRKNSPACYEKVKESKIFLFF